MFSKWKYFIISAFVLLTIICGLLIPKTKINYNALQYLPDDSQTKIAYEVMEEEFGESGSLYVFVEKVKSDDIIVLKQKLLINGVSKVEYTTNADKVLFNLVLKSNNYSEDTTRIIDQIIKLLDQEQYQYYLNGQSYLTYYFNQSLNAQIIKIVLLLSPLIILIIVLTTNSYMEPVLFILVIGISVVLNLGTNALLGSVSYMTHSIAAVIQIAVCMDYSIMLLHAYQNIKKTESNVTKAVMTAWKTTLIPIVSSALTTVAGFVAIMIMRYRIGFDIGLVLAKGVIISLITILLLLPCLIIIFDKWITKTTHKNFLIRAQKVKTTSKRFRFVYPLIAIILIASGFIIQTQNQFLYSDNTTTQNMKTIAQSNQKIKDNFGYQNPTILLIDANIDASPLITRLQAVKIDDVSYLNQIYALDQPLSSQELKAMVKEYGLNEGQIDLMMQLFGKETISLRELIMLLNQLNQSYDLTSIYQIINSLIPLTQDDLNFLYTLSGKDKLTPLEIINIVYQSYEKEDLGVLFTEQELTSIFTTIGKDQVTLAETFTYFHNLFTTEYDITTMSMVLNNQIPLEDLEKVYFMTGEDYLTLSSIITFFTKDYSSQEMATFFPELNPELISNIYLRMKASNLLINDKTTVKTFLTFLLSSEEAGLSDVEAEVLTAKLSQMMILENLDLKIQAIERQYTMFSIFAQMDLSQLAIFGNINPEMISKEFIGKEYQRIILNVNLPEESELTFAFFTKLEAEIDESNLGQYYLISSSTSVMDIKETSKNDYLYATLLSIAMIFLIILLSFRKVFVPVILVLLIQGAVFINMAIPALVGEDILFMGYIIVSCIQLGATIDYAILTTHRYVRNRQKFNPNDSMYHAINESQASIITSGLIFTLAGLSLAFFSSIPVIRSMGRLIGIGGAISMLMVLFFLPRILLVCDKIIIKKEKI